MMFEEKIDRRLSQEKIDGRRSNPGRPEKPIDWNKVDQMLMGGSCAKEIASHFDIHPTNFCLRLENKYNMNFTTYSSEKRAKGDSLIRNRQFEKALKGDNTLLIWLGKNRLNQRDTQNDLPVTNETVAQFTDLMKQLGKLQMKEDHALESSANITSSTESNEEKS